MKITLYIFLFLSTGLVYSQNPSNLKVEFKNELDEIQRGMKITEVKKEICGISSSKYSWMSFDFGGPRIFYHYWDFEYDKKRCNLRFSKTTGRRLFRPRKSNSKLLEISILKGRIYIEDAFVEISVTTFNELEKLIKNKADYEVFNDSITLKTNDGTFIFEFNTEHTLKLIKQCL